MQVGSWETSLLFLKSLSAKISSVLLVLRFNMSFIPIQVFFFHIIYVGLEIFKEILLFTVRLEILFL